ncbi:MAG: endonuclease IV, partial [Clostridia bacterium]|nr:endonuclease IV [Clostridia bacterium]
MIYIGAHVSVAKGWEAMGKTTLELGGDTFAFFLRSPRGGAAKPVVPEDAAALRSIVRKHEFGLIVAHAPYTMNLCAANPETRANGQDMLEKV